jgi:hypothetical protein
MKEMMLLHPMCHGEEFAQEVLAGVEDVDVEPNKENNEGKI